MSNAEQLIEDQLPTGWTTYAKKGGWVIATPAGDTARVDSPDRVSRAIFTLKRSAAAEARAAESAATEVPAPTARPATVAHTARCEHSDTDNNGVCYACGAYSRSADAGRTIRRYNRTH